MVGVAKMHMGACTHAIVGHYAVMELPNISFTCPNASLTITHDKEQGTLAVTVDGGKVGPGLRLELSRTQSWLLHKWFHHQASSYFEYVPPGPYGRLGENDEQSRE